MKMQPRLYGKLFSKLILFLDLYMYIYAFLSRGRDNFIGKWGQRGREVGAEGEGSGDKGGGKWGSVTPLSTPSPLGWAFRA